MRKLIMAALMTVPIAPSVAIAHGGGLNAEGCHNDRRSGGYENGGAKLDHGSGGEVLLRAA